MLPHGGSTRTAEDIPKPTGVLPSVLSILYQKSRRGASPARRSYGALTVSVRTPRLSEMTRMANSEGLNGESVETAAYANAPRRSV